MIELGYISALVEQHSGSVLSHKFEVIKSFLENVVKAVPFESIAYAIANGNYNTAMQCSKTLLAPNVVIPESSLMRHGLSAASEHLTFGVPAHLINSLNFKLYEEQPLSPAMNHAKRNVRMDSGKLVYELHSYLGTERVLHKPVKVQADVKSFSSSDMPVNEEVADKLRQLSDNIIARCSLVSERSIEELYPIQAEGSSCLLKSPLKILIDGRKRLSDLSVSSAVHSNRDMLKVVNTIRHDELDMCTSLLGGFMHQAITIIALTSDKKSQDANGRLIVNATASVGVWALFSLDYSQVQPILAQCRGEQLLVKLFDHVKGISGVSHDPDESTSDFNPYAVKLQFMVLGMTKTVTCNTQHISYSFERQLVELCSEQSITSKTPVSEITEKWLVIFRGKTLSLVHHSCRPLVARWLKWALMIHNLREELAKYIAVGVVGLVNSGKSRLVNSIFGIEVRNYACTKHINNRLKT